MARLNDVGKKKMSKHDAAVAALLRGARRRREGGADADGWRSGGLGRPVQALRESRDIRIDAAPRCSRPQKQALEDRAEAAPPNSEERRRQLALFELFMSAATV